MADKDKFKILIVLVDDNLAYQITTKLREAFKKVPIDIDFLQDAQRAFTIFKEKEHNVVLANFHLPGVDGTHLAREIRKIEGGVAIILMDSHEQDVEESGVDFVQVPISNWTEFVGKIQESIPEEMKTKYGLKRRDTKVFQKLEEYAKTFREKNGILPDAETYYREKPVSMISKYFDSSIPPVVTPGMGLEKNESIGLKTSNDPKVSQSGLVAPSEKQRKIYLVIELVLLAILLGITSYFYLSGGEEENFLSLKNLFTTLTAVSFFAFFISKTFDRFFIKGPEEEKES